MPGAPDPAYVMARKVLLDALEALHPHIDALVLVGAQAVYHHTGDTDLAVAEYTTDADLSIAPALVGDEPLIAQALAEAGFTADVDLGRWISSEGIPLDLLVPEAEAGPGNRGSDLGVHGRRIARRARGLEASLIDSQLATIRSLDAADLRHAEVKVAGPGALLVAKLVKIGERIGQPGRGRDKDALDILRILRSVPVAVLAGTLIQLLATGIAAETTSEAIGFLRAHFTEPSSEGILMAMRATQELDDREIVTMSGIVLAQDLLEALDRSNSE